MNKIEERKNKILYFFEKNFKYRYFSYSISSNFSLRSLKIIYLHIYYTIFIQLIHISNKT